MLKALQDIKTGRVGQSVDKRTVVEGGNVKSFGWVKLGKVGLGRFWKMFGKISVVKGH